MPFTEHDALLAAVEASKKSPCKKSQRGVVIFDAAGVLASGYNQPPEPFRCDGSPACRDACSKLCVHAEVDAILNLGSAPFKVITHLLHVETCGGDPIWSGPPSCWQCSRVILAAGIDVVWLLHDTGLRRYSPMEFHELTLQFRKLPVIR